MANNKVNIVVTAEDKASKPLRQIAGEIDETSKSGSRFNSIMGSAMKVALTATAAGAAALSGGLIAASKASFDQVKAVEEARFGLMAYEKDAGKVQSVLQGLVSYAQSDMGVLFNRKDMFAAASTLKMYGNETETLTDRVKILSKGVAQGKTTFQELSSIVGRAASKGRLDAVDFDMLIERGIGLDKSFRGSAVTAEQLWKALDKALPDELLAGRANTIEGRMIRLQSAFRNVGNQVLGVDKQTNDFIKGGLGDRFIQGLGTATDALKYFSSWLARPEVQTNIAAISTALTGLVSGGLEWLSTNVPPIVEALVSFGSAAGTYLTPKLAELWRSIQDNLMPILTDLWRNVIEPLIPVIAVTLVGAFGLVVDIARNLVDGLGFVYDKIAEGNPIIWGLIGLFGTLAGAMAFNAVFNALTVGFATLRLVTIPSVMTSLGLLKAAILAPIVMPAIVVGAAIASLALVLDAANRARAAIDGAMAASDRERETSVNLMKSARARYDRGEITMDQLKKQVGIYANAIGTGYSPGGTTLVGENGPELVTMPRGAQVTPNYRTRNELSDQGGGGVTNNLNGNFTFSTAESVSAFFNRLDASGRLARSAGM